MAAFMAVDWGTDSLTPEVYTHRDWLGHPQKLSSGRVAVHVRDGERQVVLFLPVAALLHVAQRLEDIHADVTAGEEVTSDIR